MMYKVLKPGRVSPYQEFVYELGKWYECADFAADHDAGHNGCASGFYAVEIEGLPYSYRKGDHIYEVEVGGRNVKWDIYKWRWERLRLVRECSPAEVKRDAREAEARLGYKLTEILWPIDPRRVRRSAIRPKDVAFLGEWASLGVSLRDSLGASLRDSLWASLRALLGDSLWDSLWASLGVSLRDSLWDSLWASLWDSLWDSLGGLLWDSLGAYAVSLFPNITEWKHLTHKQHATVLKCAELWRRGIVPLKDDDGWALYRARGWKRLTKEERDE
jgi:hypothetical protein